MTLAQPFPRNLRYRLHRGLLGLLERLDPGTQLDRDGLERQSLRIAGASEFLDTSFREPLDVFLESLRREGQLNSVGRYLTSFFVRRCLVNRLSLEQVWGGARPAARPDAWPEKPPLYLVGMPRTGTTLLQRMLAADPSARPLLFWEAYYPVRTPTRFGAPRSAATRQRVAVAATRWLYQNAPYVRGIHEVEPLGPEECYFLLSNTLVSYSLSTQWYCPSYADWLQERTEADWVEVYKHYLATLRTLEGDMRGRHWVLKCPLHAPRLGTLSRLVPNAIFIQTYRDASELVPSMCSLAAALISLGSDAWDPREIGQKALQVLAAQSAQSVRAGAELADRVVSVHYKSLIKDPLGTIRAIYDRAGMPLTAAAETAMKGWLASNPQGRHGQHHYTLADFGLTEPQVQEAFREYTAMERSLAPA